MSQEANVTGRRGQRLWPGRGLRMSRVRGYFRDPGRAAPHNLYARGSQLLSQAAEASKARDIGFRFGPAPSGGRPVTSFPVSYPAASFTFRWSAGAGRWLVGMDGKQALAAEGRQLTSAAAPTTLPSRIIVCRP